MIDDGFEHNPRISRQALAALHEGAFGWALSLTGYDDTRGVFSMDTADQAFTFDADTRAVPAPGALALIAIGLVGLALERRRR